MSVSFLNSICVIRLTALGDCINAFGLLNALHSNYPNIDIKWIIDKRFASLFIDDEGFPLVPFYSVDLKGDGLLKSCFKLFLNFRKQRYAALFNMQTSIKSSILSLFIRADSKYGYDEQRRREGQLLFINKQVPSPQNKHVLAGFMAFAHAAGFENLEPCWDYKLSEKEFLKAKQLVNGINSKFIIIAPASAKKVKNWTVQGYSEIANYAFSKGFKVVLVGGSNKTEIQLCDEIKQQAPDCLNLCGRTSLRDLACIISLSSLVLSPDSASMHLASSLNIPVIGLFAIHDPKRVGAWNYPDLQVSVYEEMAMAELGQQTPGWRYRVKDPDAMKRISVHSVKEKFDFAIDKYRL